MQIIPKLARSLGLATLITLGLAAPSQATLSYYDYAGPNDGLWSSPGNWQPNGLPGQSSIVNIGQYDPGPGMADLNVTFNIDSSILTLTLDTAAVSGYVIVNETAPNLLLRTGQLDIGTYHSRSRYNLGASAVSVGTLNMGVTSASTNNTFNLFGTGYLELTSALNIGAAGSGTFNQTGGTVTAVNSGTQVPINLGVSATGSGIYNLSSGALSVSTINVGIAGTGIFNQTGGASENPVEVGSASGGTGTYNLSGGTLKAYSANVNHDGTFNAYSGGTLTSSFVGAKGGTFNLLGGTLVPDRIYLETGGVFNFSSGSITKTPNISFGPGGGTLNLIGHSLNAEYLDGAAGVIQNGGAGSGVLTVHNFVIPHNNIYGGTFQDGGGMFSLVLTASADETLTGTSTYTGSTTLVTGTLLTAGSTTAFSPNSPYMISGGTLDTGGFAVTLGSLGGTTGTVAVGAGSITTDGSIFGYGGQITGSGIIHKIGPGSFTLTGGGTFTGAFDIQAGSLSVNAANGIPTSAAVNLSGFNTILNVNASQSISTLSGGTLSSTTFANSPTLTVGGSNTSTSYSTNFSGTGTLVKVGSGTFTLGYGASDTIGPNTDSALTMNVNSGTLALAKAPGTTAVAGPLNIYGGTVALFSSNQISDTSIVSLLSGTLNLAGYSETIGGISGGGTIAYGGGTLTVAQAVTSACSATMTGTGAFIKAGAADLTLTGAGSFTGTFNASAGRLILQSALSASGLSASSGGTLQFKSNTVSLGAGSILASAGGTVEYSGATISNGFLLGPGAHTVLAGTSSTFSSVTNTSGNITVNGTLNTSNFISNGGVTVSSGGTLTAAAGTTIEMNGALLVNYGAQNGVLNVNSSSTVKGDGTFGTVNINSGGKFSPGNSPGNATVGSLTMGSGGGYTFELNTANPTPGVTSDLITVTNTLAINAGTTAGTVFTIAPVTLNAANQAAPLTDFDPSHAYAFLLGSAGNITGFSASEFAVDTSGFANSLAGGSFSVAQNTGSTNLLLRFLPVTPPATAVWRGDQSSAWNTVTNGATNFYSDTTGTTNTALPGAITDVTFSTSNVSAASLSATLGADFAVRSLVFNASSSVPVTIGGANTLTLGSGGLTVASGSPADTISAQVLLGTNQTWTNNSVNSLTVSGQVSGPGKLITAGGGRIILTGVNTYAGGTTIGNGTLSGTTTSLHGPITNNATLDITQAAGGTLSSPVTGTGKLTANISAGAIVTLTGANSYAGTTTVNSGTVSVSTSSVGTGTVIVNSVGTIDYTQGGPGTANSNITGTGTVTFGRNTSSPNGAGGTVTYTSVDNVSGGTTISSGKVILNHAGGGALTGPVAVATGASLVLGSANQVQEPVSTTLTLSGGTLAAAGHSDGTPTAAALGRLQLSGSTSTLDFGDANGLTPTTLSFADSAGLTWTGTLQIQNYSAGQDALYIGTSSSLSAAQLSSIMFGGSNAQQLGTGQIVFAPEPGGLLPLLLGACGIAGLAARRRRK